MKNKLPNQKKEISAKAKRNAGLVIALSFAFAIFYFAAMSISTPIIPAKIISEAPILLADIVFTLYLSLFAGFFAVYIAYNRAFSRRGVTVEMLPDSMTKAEKEEYVADAKNRLEKSKWMLLIIIPLMVTIALDAIYLFTWPMIQTLFNLS